MVPSRPAPLPIAIAIALVIPGSAGAAPGDLLARYSFETTAPQDIAFDGEIFYVTSFLDHEIHRVAADLVTPLPPFPSPHASFLGSTGIAFDSIHRTLWIVEPLSREIAEIDLEGNPTHRTITPEFLPVVTPGASPLPRGIPPASATWSVGSSSSWTM